MAAIGATLTVTNTGDSGSGSLRQALIDAADGDTINFELQLPAVIDLTTGPLSIDKDVEILGSGANLLTIQTDPAKEPLHVIDIPPVTRSRSQELPLPMALLTPGLPAAYRIPEI